jgi:four helix bundle protein
MKGHRDLIAWQKAMALVTAIYQATKDFPREEIFGLTSQIRRAAVSIPSNLAEGVGRNSANELRHFIGHARGSLLEVETQLEIALNLNFLSQPDFDSLFEKTSELGKVINGLRAWSAAAGSD